MHKITNFPVWLVLAMAVACMPAPAPTPAPVPTSVPTVASTPTLPPAAEVLPVTIPLAGSLAHARSELSGLAWYGDNLILLPQYPDFEKRRKIDSDAEPGAFAVAKQDILAVLDGTRSEPLAGKKIKWIDVDLAAKLDAQGYPFQGYESIAFVGDAVFVTAEAQNKDDKNIMQAFVLAGRIAPDLSSITIDTSVMTPIRSPAPLNNMSQESMIAVDGKLVTFYEANGVGVNPAPVGSVFDQKTLAPAGRIPLSNIDYRMTDATPLDSAGKFWAINYQFPGEIELLIAPRVDAIAQRHGQGETHSSLPQVERIVEFQYSGTGITLTERPPVQLRLVDQATVRNWEGIARLEGRGFLIATDTYPATILAFVPMH